jgi:hypothetical protein
VHEQRVYVVIGVKLGNAMVTADVGMTALQEPPGETSEMRSLSNIYSYFGCPLYDFCENEQVMNLDTACAYVEKRALL